MKLVWFLMIVFVQKSLQKEEGTIPVGVTRRSSGDIVFFDETSEHTVCVVTYLVEERQCVSDQDVINGCSSAIIPIESMSPVALTPDPSTSSSVIAPIKTAEADRDAIFHFREANQTISSSHCEISSLEVYRGREQVIKISHEGFLLSGSGSIEINYSEGTYTREEYSGELYRMNLSCSGGGLPQSGCLFFKVGGKSNITNAKFNCTVPGTLAKECHNSPTTTNTISATTSPITISSKPTTALSSLSPTSGFEVGSTYFLIVVICGVLGAALIVAIVLVCFMVCLLRRKIRPSSVQTAPLEAKSCKQESSLQYLDSKQVEDRYDTVAQEYETVISNGGMTGGESHIYAELESSKNPRHYSDPIKGNPRISKERSHSNALEKRRQEHMPVPGAQYYDNPTNIMQETLNQPQLDQIRLAEGLSGDVLEHKYAELERQPLAQMHRQSLTQEGEGHQYDAPPREDENGLRPHPSDKDDPANHVYAILEKC